MTMSLIQIFVIAGVILVALLTIGLILARLYQRASKEVSFVRTGLGGQVVVVNGGALVLPVLHETIPVNMNTLRLEVQRANTAALITKDRMRVDVQAEFYVRVQPTKEAIADAAQTLGQRTMYPDALKELVEGKFVDALRAVAAEMSMEELHEQRVEFVQKVQQAVSEDLLKNGLELESVSLTGLDQTDREYFNPNNAFDAAGLTRLTFEIEDRRKKRNDIEQDTSVEIERKNLEARRLSLEISRDKEYAELEQQREIEVRRASQTAEIAREQAARKQEAEQAEIAASRAVREAEIERERAVEAAEIERKKLIQLSDQDREIAVAEKSQAESEAQANADRARAEAVRASEQVTTVRDTEVAEREKAVDLVEARRIAEREAIQVKVKAEADRVAAEDEAESIRTLAEAHKAEYVVKAEGEAAAIRLRAEADELRLKVEAAGRQALNEADNLLSEEIVTMKVRLAVIEHLQDIVRESVKPMEQIDGIKIIQVDGLNGAAAQAGAAAAGNGGGNGGGSLADQLVAGALRYRGQAPLIDALLKDIGMDGASLDGLTRALKPVEDAEKTSPEPEPPVSEPEPVTADLEPVISGTVSDKPEDNPPSIV